MQPTTHKSKNSGHRVTAAVATIVAALSLAAGAQSLQQPTATVALPAGGCDEFGCGMNHNEVLASTSLS